MFKPSFQQLDPCGQPCTPSMRDEQRRADQKKKKKKKKIFLERRRWEKKHDIRIDYDDPVWDEVYWFREQFA